MLSVQCSGDTRDGEGYLACFGESLLQLSENDSIQVKFATVDLCGPCFKCNICLQFCLLLQELKFFGAVLTLPMLENLLAGLRTGFKALCSLEFPVELSSGFSAQSAALPPASTAPTFTASGASRVGTAVSRHGKLFDKGYANQPTQRVTCVSLAEAVVEAAKARAFAGRVGLSVTVNYR